MEKSWSKEPDTLDRDGSSSYLWWGWIIEAIFYCDIATEVIEVQTPQTQPKKRSIDIIPYIGLPLAILCGGWIMLKERFPAFFPRSD